MMIRFAGAIVIAVLVFCLNFYPFAHADGPLYRNQVAVLVYHEIDDTSPGMITITTSQFIGQLRDLLDRGYHFIGLDQFKGFLSGTGTVPDNAILVTFDDGYESFYTTAYPILHKLHIPAVNFVITKDLEDPKGTNIPSISPEEIQSIASKDSGMEFQCHSDSLHQQVMGRAYLTTKLLIHGSLESEEQYETRVLDDTHRCLQKLQALNTKTVDTYAYPFGYYNAKAVELLQHAGIKFGFTTRRGMATIQTDPLQIPRINAGSPYVKDISVNNLIMQTIHHAFKETNDTE